jgi:hypothetical protein
MLVFECHFYGAIVLHAKYRIKIPIMPTSFKVLIWPDVPKLIVGNLMRRGCWSVIRGWKTEQKVWYTVSRAHSYQVNSPASLFRKMNAINYVSAGRAYFFISCSPSYSGGGGVHPKSAKPQGKSFINDSVCVRRPR